MAWLFKQPLQLMPVFSWIFAMWHHMNTTSPGLSCPPWCLGSAWILADKFCPGFEYWIFHLKKTLIKMVFSFDSLSKIFYLWAFGFDFTFAISLGKENSDFFEMHHVSVTLRAKLLKDFIVWRLQMHVQRWNVWISLYKDTLEISEKNLN